MPNKLSATSLGLGGGWHVRSRNGQAYMPSKSAYSVVRRYSSARIFLRSLSRLGVDVAIGGDGECCTCEEARLLIQSLIKGASLDSSPSIT